jgi:hypothetical protein
MGVDVDEPRCQDQAAEVDFLRAGPASGGHCDPVAGDGDIGPNPAARAVEDGAATNDQAVPGGGDPGRR